MVSQSKMTQEYKDILEKMVKDVVEGKAKTRSTKDIYIEAKRAWLKIFYDRDCRDI